MSDDKSSKFGRAIFSEKKYLNEFVSIAFPGYEVKTIMKVCSKNTNSAGMLFGREENEDEMGGLYKKLNGAFMGYAAYSEQSKGIKTEHYYSIFITTRHTS